LLAGPFCSLAMCNNKGATSGAQSVSGKVRGSPADLFDIAEALENGGGRGLVSDTTVPPTGPLAVEEQRFTFLTAKHKEWLKLQNAAGETLAIARPNGDDRFDVFVARTGPHAPRTLFSRCGAILASGHAKRREWSLIQLSCDRCAAVGKRHCGHVAWARMRLEPTKNQGTKLEVDLPGMLSNGQQACMCDVCGDAAAQWSPELLKKGTDATSRTLELETISGSGEAPLLLQPIDAFKSTLTCRAPLGMLQAFAIAVVMSQ